MGRWRLGRGIDAASTSTASRSALVTARNWWIDTSEPARVLMFSPKSPTGITVYPDLGRVNAMAGDQDLPLALQRDEGDLHYYEHEG